MTRDKEERGVNVNIESTRDVVARCSAVALAGPVMRAVLQVFENYQKARVNFAELATRPQSR